MSVLDIMKAQSESMTEYRRWLHHHAELAWEEFETTEFIENKLREAGIEPYRYGDRTGCGAMIRGGRAGENAKTILLRADIDAMPGHDRKNLPYSSKNPGAVHSCGHDGHVTMLLHAAKYLNSIKDELEGNVKLIFEAAEEGRGGAKYYVSQGLMEDVDAVFGIHMWDCMEENHISIESGPVLSCFNRFKITVHGYSNITSAPHMSKDAIMAAAKVVENLDLLETHMIDPQEPLVIAVGTIHGGSAANSYCDEVVLEGTIRTFSKTFMETMEEKITDVVDHSVKMLGCTADVEIVRGAPAVIHGDENLNQLTRNAAVKLMGEDVLRSAKPCLASDTFAYYSEHVPGVFAFLGTVNEEKGFTAPLHNDDYNLDECVLPTGAALFVQVAIDYLSEQ